MLMHGKPVTLIDESYNANPKSMAAAIATLGLYKGRKIAVLGDMLELGKDEISLHKNLMENIKKAGVDKVICCGPRMKALYDILPKSMQADWFENASSCVDGLRKILQNNDTIMIKGSNASGLGKLVTVLSKHKVDADNQGDMSNVL